MLKTLTDGHEDGVSSLIYANSGLNLISSSHDGSVKVWDLRNWKLVGDLTSAHSKKFDEGAMCLASHSHAPFFASGGADCLINIFEFNL